MEIIQQSTLQFNASTAKFRVKDTTDLATNALYPGEISTSLLAKVLDEEVIFYNKYTTISPSIAAIASSPSYSEYTDLPTDGQGSIVQGDYKLITKLAFTATAIENSIQMVSASGLGTVKAVIVGKNLTQVLHVGDVITFTEFVAANNNVARTISGVEYIGSDTHVYFATGAFTAVTENARYTFLTYSPELEQEYNYTCKKTKACPVVNVDCIGTRYGKMSLKYSLALPQGHTLDSKSWEINHPNNLTPAPLVDPLESTNTSYTVSQLATGQWTYTLTLMVSYTQDDNLAVIYNAGYEDSITVVCPNFCNIKCCLEKIVAAHEFATGGNVFGKSQYTPILNTINIYFPLYLSAMYCGDSSKAELYFNKISEAIGQSGACVDQLECGGCTDNPQWIDNMAGDSNSSIQDILEDLMSSVSNLTYQLEVLGAESELNAFLAAIVALQSQVNQEQADVNTVLAAYSSLNPNSTTFAADLLAVQALYPTVDFSTLIANAGLLQASLVEIQTSYPTIDVSYFTDAQTALTNLQAQLANAQTNWNSITAIIDATTQLNYASQIASLEVQINNLNDSLSFVYNAFLDLNASVNNYAAQINYINTQLVAINEAIQALQNQPTAMTSKVLVLGARESKVGGATIAIPPKYKRKGGYVKILVMGKDPLAIGTVFTVESVDITDGVTSIKTIATKLVADKVFKMEMIIRPDLSTTDPFDSIASGVFTGGVPDEYIEEVLNGSTEWIYNEYGMLRIGTDSITCKLTYEVLGYSETWNLIDE